MTNSNNNVAAPAVAVILIVDLERTSAVTATAAIQARIEHPDSDASHRTFEYHTASLREDGLGERMKEIVTECRERGITESMCVLAGEYKGEAFQKPMQSNEIQSTLEQYANMVAMEDMLKMLESAAS